MGCGAGSPGPASGTRPAPRPPAQAQASQGKIVNGFFESSDGQLRVKTPGALVQAMGGGFRYEQAENGVRQVNLIPMAGPAPHYLLTVVPNRVPQQARGKDGPALTADELRHGSATLEANYAADRLQSRLKVIRRWEVQGRFGTEEQVVLTSDSAAVPGCRRLDGSPCLQAAIVSVYSFGSGEWSALLTVTQFVRELSERAVQAHLDRKVPHVQEMLGSVVVGDAVR